MPPTLATARTGGAGGGGFAGFGAALFAALWAYSGWQYLPMAASEVQEPQRNLPRAIVGGTLLVLAIYLLINTAYLYALPLWQVASANSTAYPEAPSVAARAVQSFLGAGAAPVAALIFLVSTVGSLNGMMLTAARVAVRRPRATGCSSHAFGRLSPAARVPAFSLVLLACLWAAVLCSPPRVPSSSSPTWPSCRMRSSGSRCRSRSSCSGGAGRTPRAPTGVPLDPLVPLLFALVMVWIVVSALLTSPRESLAAIVLILLGSAALPAVPAPPWRGGRGRGHAVSSSQRVSGAPRRSQNPRPASRKWRRSRRRYQAGAAQVHLRVGARTGSALYFRSWRVEGAEVERAAAQGGEVRERAARGARIQVLQHVVADDEVEGRACAQLLDAPALPTVARAQVLASSPAPRTAPAAASRLSADAQHATVPQPASSTRSAGRPACAAKAAIRRARARISPRVATAVRGSK